MHVTRLTRSYEPSFFPAEERFVSDNHERAVELVEDVRGKLESADHHKLYEAGYFARGPVLEIGRLHAKSAILIALGLHDAGGGHRLVSVEYEDRYLAPGRANLERFGVLEHVELLQGDSSEIVRSLPGSFDTVFVDGDHTYEGVRRDLDALAGRIDPGGVVMFHDYYHHMNDSGDYGVARAVDARREALGLEFRGRFGGIALFERVPRTKPRPTRSRELANEQSRSIRRLTQRARAAEETIREQYTALADQAKRIERHSAKVEKLERRLKAGRRAVEKLERRLKAEQRSGKKRKKLQKRHRELQRSRAVRAARLLGGLSRQAPGLAHASRLIRASRGMLRSSRGS